MQNHLKRKHNYVNSESRRNKRKGYEWLFYQSGAKVCHISLSQLGSIRKALPMKPSWEAPVKTTHKGNDVEGA